MAHTAQSMCDGKGVMNIDGGDWSEVEVSNFRLSGSNKVSLKQWYLVWELKDKKEDHQGKTIVKSTLEGPMWERAGEK